MDDKTKQLIEMLKQNPNAARDLLRSQDGQSLLRLLTQSDHGAALQHAAQNAARGDTSEMVRIISQLMQSQEGAQLVERINKAVQQS